MEIQNYEEVKKIILSNDQVAFRAILAENGLHVEPEQLSAVFNDITACAKADDAKGIMSIVANSANPNIELSDEELANVNAAKGSPRASNPTYGTKVTTTANGSKIYTTVGG